MLTLTALGGEASLCTNTNILLYRVRNLKFTRNLKSATSKTLVNFMKKMMFLSKYWYFSVQKALIYYTVNKSHHNSFILLVFSPVANFRYVANFRFLTLYIPLYKFLHMVDSKVKSVGNLNLHHSNFITIQTKNKVPTIYCTDSRYSSNFEFSFYALFESYFRGQKRRF